MRRLLIAALIAHCASCTNHLPEQTVSPTDTQPGPSSPATITFQSTNGVGGWTFSDSPNNTLSAPSYSRVVSDTITVRFTPPSDRVVSEWIGADSENGDTATIVPHGADRTVTVVLAPSAGG